MILVLHYKLCISPCCGRVPASALYTGINQMIDNPGSTCVLFVVYVFGYSLEILLLF